MEAIFLVRGAGGPQLKRNPLGNSHNTMRVVILATCALLGCAGPHWPSLRLPSVAPDAHRGAVVGAVVSWLDGRAIDPVASLVVQAETSGALLPPIAVPVDTTGVFVTPHLTPGRYRIAVRALGYLSLDTTCHVDAGRVDTLILMLDADVVGPIQVRPARDRLAAVRPRAGMC